MSKVKSEGPRPGVAREVAGLADGREREGFERGAGRAAVPGRRAADEREVAVEVGAVVAHVVEVAVGAAEAEVEGRAGGEAEDGREA